MKEQEVVVSNPLVSSTIASKIVVIRDVQVMIDRDLAELYGVETKVLTQTVKRNAERFPDYFCFQLDKEESLELVTNCDRFNILKHSSSNPYAFTEQGVAMLSAVLRSERAVKVSIEIMNAFVQMRHYLRHNISLVGRLNAFENKVETRLVEHEIKFQKIDENFSKIFNALDATPKRAKEGVFFKGQIFDAYAFFQDIIKTAKKVKIYTHPKAELRQIDVDQFNQQYPTATMDYTQKMHDRFLIIDNKDLYHIGASLKDLGKQCFAFDKMEDSKTLIPAILSNLS